MHNRDLFHSKWLLYIKSILNDCGKDYFWLNQNEIPTNNINECDVKVDGIS